MGLLPPSLQQPASTACVQPPRSLLPCCLVWSASPASGAPSAPSPLAWVALGLREALGTAEKQETNEGLTLGIPGRQHQRRGGVYLQAPPALAGPRGGGGPGLAWPSGRCKSLACSSGYAETLARLLQQPPSPAAGEPPTLGLAWATVPIKHGATCGQGPAEASWESRRWPRSPQPNWKARLNFPGDKQKEKEGDGPHSSPAPAALTYLHPSRSPCRSHPAVRCSRSLRIWLRCPCTPAPRSAP